jgi:hypothetical protein
MSADNTKMTMTCEAQEERKKRMAEKYERRLEQCKKWQRKYYQEQSDTVNYRSLLIQIAKGKRCPKRFTVESILNPKQIESEKPALREAWDQYIRKKLAPDSKIPERVYAFHSWLHPESPLEKYMVAM